MGKRTKLAWTGSQQGFNGIVVLGLAACVGGCEHIGMEVGGMERVIWRAINDEFSFLIWRMGPMSFSLDSPISHPVIGNYLCSSGVTPTGY